MSNKHFLLLLFFCLSKLAFSQTNLLVDGGFEALIGEKTNYYYTDLINWTDPNNGYPVYLNELSFYNNLKPQGSAIFGQKPRGGRAIVALIVMQDSYPNKAGEYVQSSFTNELISGKTYKVKFYVSMANGSGIAVSHLGAFLSEEPVAFTFRSSLVPQIESNQLLNDTLSWVEISSNYISKGGEKYITIGNFKDDKASDTVHVVPNIHTIIGNSFYLIDDVSVVCLDCSIDEVGVGIVEQNQNPKNVVFNNSTNTLNVSDGGLLIIYNMQGSKVLEQNIKQEQNINLPLLPKAVYVWQLQTEKEVQQGKFMVNE